MHFEECEAEARHMYCFSGVVVVVVVVVVIGGGGVNFLCLGHFLRNYKGQSHDLGHAYILKSYVQPYVQFWDLTYFSRFIDKCRVFAFRSFSRKL